MVTYMVFPDYNYVGMQNIVNPMALLEVQNGETRVDKLVGNIYGEITFIEGLKFRTSLGIDLAYVLDDSYRPLYYLNGAQNNTDKTSVFKGIDRYFTWQWENTLSYTKKIKDHNFSVLAGTTANEHNYEDLTGFNAKVPTTDPDNILFKHGYRHCLGFNRRRQVILPFLHFWQDTLMIIRVNIPLPELLRRDGSSRFGPNNRYGILPVLRGILDDH